MWSAFWQLARTRERHERLTFTDIRDFSSVTGVRLGEWEAVTLLGMWQELISQGSAPPLSEEKFSLSLFDAMFEGKK